MWPNRQETPDLVIYTEEIVNGKRLSLPVPYLNTSMFLLTVSVDITFPYGTLKPGCSLVSSYSQNNVHGPISYVIGII